MWYALLYVFSQQPYNEGSIAVLFTDEQTEVSLVKETHRTLALLRFYMTAYVGILTPVLNWHFDTSLYLIAQE